MQALDGLAMQADSPQQPEQPPAGSGSRRRVLRTIALYSLGLLFLALVLWRSEFWTAGDTLDDVTPVSLVVVLLMCVLPAIPLALRGRELLIAMGFRASPVALAPVSFYGNTAGFLTPASSGELLRPTLLEQAFNVPARAGAGLVVYERLYSFFLFVLAGVIALMWTGITSWPVAAVATPVLFLVAFAPPLVYALSHSRVPMDRPAALLPGWLRRRLGAMEETGSTLQQLLESTRLTFTFVGSSTLVFIIMIAQYWILVEGLGESLTPAEAGVVLVFANLAGVLSALPLGLGAMDVTMVALLRAYGVDVEPALAVVVLTRCLIHLPTGLLGLLAYLVALQQRHPGHPGRTGQQSPLAPNGDARA